MRIELRDTEVPPDGVMPGRVYFDMKEPATVESIGIDINKTLAMTTPDGRVILVRKTPKFFISS